MSLLSWCLGLLFAGRVVQPVVRENRTTEPRTEPRSQHLDGLRISPRASAAFAAMDQQVSPFRLPRYAPGVIPEGMALDDVNTSIQAVFDFGSSFHGMFAEGIGFMGYPYLAELSQRAEYRRAVETVAEEMTRRWIKISADGEQDKTDKVKQLEDALDKFRVRDAFRKAIEHDGYFGRGMLYLDYGESDPAELRTRLVYKPEKLAKGALKAIRVIDPVWTGPNQYSATDPTRTDFYAPQSWFVMGKVIHATRLLMIVSRPLPDILKPAYAFSGLSLTQIMKPYVDNWLRTRQSISDLVSSFTQFNLATDLTSYLGGGDASPEGQRLRDFADTRNNRGLLVTDKEKEELNNVSAPLGTLDKLQAQAQEQIAAIVGQPLVKYLGITPSGLNASSDGEVRVFYDHMHALQERVLDDPMRTILRLLQIDIWGEADEEIDFEWVPLFELDEVARATLRKTNADTDAVLANDIGAIDADEVRQRVAAELDSPYSGLDLTKPAPGPPAPTGMEDMYNGLGGEPVNAEQAAAAAIAQALAGSDPGEDATPAATTPEDALVAALAPPDLDPAQGTLPLDQVVPAPPGAPHLGGIVAAALTVRRPG